MRAIEPAAMGVDQRSPGKWVGEPAAHFQPLFDRVAAALDQLLGEVTPAGVELDQRQVAEPLSRVRLVAVVARPVGFSAMACSSGFDIVDALKPDQRNRVRVGGWPRLCLEREPALHELGAGSPSQSQVEQAQVDQQRREYFRLLVGAYVPHGPLGVFEGAGRLSRDTDQNEPCRDPGAERGVACRLDERLFEMRGREPERAVVPLDLGEQLQSLGLQRGQQTLCVHLLCKQARINDIAGL